MSSNYIPTVRSAAVLVAGVVFIAMLFSFKSSKQPYQLFDSNGKRISHAKWLKTCEKGDVVCFGEFHNNPISHWLQLELVKDLHNRRPLDLGMEMVERDNQSQLDAYLAGTIDHNELDSTARLWSNYDTDYKPLVDFAKEHQIPFTGTNIPRRFANLVYKQGGFAALDSLSEEEKAWIAPLPVAFDPALPQYQEILSMMPDHATAELVMAQAIKDATMAHFIAQSRREDHLYIHFNGAFHTDFHEGILWYLNREKPDWNVVTISTVEQSEVQKLDPSHKGRADFILVVDEDMTKTYLSRWR